MESILGIQVKKQSKGDILDKIIKYTVNPRGFFHIVSLNPENLVIAHNEELFKRVINTAQIKIVDGIGIVIAGQILGVKVGERLTGVDLMTKLVKMASEGRLRVVLIGGEGNLALRLAQCYNSLYPKAKFVGMEGIKDIHRPKESEEDKVFSIVSDIRPHIILVSFGSPFQEIWLWKHRKRLNGILCMGVGGAFDYLAGTIRRAPTLIRYLGLEWFYRLVRQPWRWRRQLRLIEFMSLVLKEKWKKTF